MKNINERWKEFEKCVIPKEAPKVQRVEMKRAYFAGWIDALFALKNEISELPEEEGIDMLAKFLRECDGFTEAIRQGVA